MVMDLDKKEVVSQLDNVDGLDQLDEVYDKYLGNNWQINKEFRKFWELSDEEKKKRGKFLSELKEQFEQKYKNQKNKLKKKQLNKELAKEMIDVSTPVNKSNKWNYNRINKLRRQIEDVFKTMRFGIEYGYEVTTKYENFYSLNIPATHPATEAQDTFYLKQKDGHKEPLVLRSQTSALQNKYLKKYWNKTKVIIPWKVYRSEKMDASHDTAFWQLEGVYVDENVSIGNFKYLMQKILSFVFGPDTELRMRPGYFPFVEPGFEIDSKCPMCSWDGCKLCQHMWWIELLGAGMIHPNVLENADIDSNRYNGFAFGCGINRISAIKYGVKDIRLFTRWDLRFIKSK